MRNLAAMSNAVGMTSHRLGSTLFLATLVHGVIILGVTFTSGPPGDSADTPALKVTLLASSRSRSDEREDAEYIANRNELGGRADTAEDFRPTNAPSFDHAVLADGDPTATDAEDSGAQQPNRASQHLTSRVAADPQTTADPDHLEQVSEAPLRSAAKIDLREIQTLAAEFDTRVRVPSSEHELDDRASPSARASILAGYLDAWRQRVELVGTLNFPDKYLTDNVAYRRPTLEVAIDADGSLADVIVQNSSGDRAVDQAAIDILRMAAPFEPFPEPISVEYETLRFAYDWDFNNGKGVTSH